MGSPLFCMSARHPIADRRADIARRRFEPRTDITGESWNRNRPPTPRSGVTEGNKQFAIGADGGHWPRQLGPQLL